MNGIYPRLRWHGVCFFGGGGGSGSTATDNTPQTPFLSEFGLGIPQASGPASQPPASSMSAYLGSTLPAAGSAGISASMPPLASLMAYLGGNTGTGSATAAAANPPAASLAAYPGLFGAASPAAVGMAPSQGTGLDPSLFGGFNQGSG